MKLRGQHWKAWSLSWTIYDTLIAQGLMSGKKLHVEPWMLN